MQQGHMAAEAKAREIAEEQRAWAAALEAFESQFLDDEPPLPPGAAGGVLAGATEVQRPPPWQAQ